MEAYEIGAGYMIRGLRNNMDDTYEENIAEGNTLFVPQAVHALMPEVSGEREGS